jgi:murein DD-endopeptidase MepM/ murein hydrolase activator NlpD
MQNPLVGKGYDQFIGTRQNPGQTQTEFYNKETNQAYANPSDLLRAVQPYAGNQVVDESNVFSVLAQGYTPRDTALNQIKNDINSFQDQTFNSGAEAGKRAASSINDKIGAERDNYDTYFKEYTDLKNKLNSLSAPNYQQSYNELRQSSGIGAIENDFANNQKAIRELPYVNRMNFGNAAVATEGQLQADTAQKGIPLEIQQANLLDRLKLAESFINNSLKFKELDQNAARQSLADGLQTALQTIELSRSHLNDLMQQQAAQKASEEKAQQFAYENRIGQPFYEIGGTVYRTSDGRPATSPQDYIAMGGNGKFTDVQKVDVSQTFANQLALAQFELQKEQLEYQKGATKYQLGTDAWGNPIVFNPRTGTYTGGDTPGSGSQPYYGLAPKVYDKAAAIVSQFDGEAIVKKYNIIADGNNYAQSIDPNTKNAAEHQALIYGLAKALDPDSVVREGEYATIQKYSQSWLEAFGFNAQRVVNNQGLLTADSIKKIQGVIRDKYNSASAQYQNVFGEYARRVDAATGVKGKGNEMLTDYSKAYSAQSDPVLNSLWGDGFTTSTPLDLNKALSSGGLTFNSVGNTSASKKVNNDSIWKKLSSAVKYYGSPLWEKGLDIAWKKGTSLPSPFAGVVAAAGFKQGWGNQVIMKLAGGYEAMFSHLDRINVKPGQKITPNTLLGLVGNTGNVLKSDGSKPTAKELAAGRGAHLDLTIKKPDGKYMTAKEVEQFLNRYI